MGWSRGDRGASVVQAGAADCQITGSRLVGVRFTGAEHHRLRFRDVVLDDCELSGAVLSEATFVRVQFNRCRMSGLAASGLIAHDVTWSECKLDGVNLRAATLERSEWSDSLMNEADFYAARLTTSSFYPCDLTSAEFSKADVTVSTSTDPLWRESEALTPSGDAASDRTRLSTSPCLCSWPCALSSVTTRTGRPDRRSGGVVTPESR